MNLGVRSQVAGVGSQVSGARSQVKGDRSQVTGHRLAVALVAALVIAAAGSLLYSAHGTAVSGNATTGKNPVHHVSLPLFFEPNQGQTDAQVKFLARGSGYGLFLTSNEAVLSLKPSALSPRPSVVSGKDLGRTVIRMRLEGANNSARVTGAERLPGKSNYFIGNDPKKWRSGIPQFARVNYEAIYPGVDLTYYGNQGQLEYDFRVAPGADPNQIALAFEGASARIEGGELVLSTGQGDVRFQAPAIYQRSGNTKTAVPGSFRQLAGNKIGFEIGLYDRRRELVIDPVLSYSTYLGGSGAESLTQIAVDSGSNMYVAAATTSADFPGSPSGSLSGVQDVIVTKIDPAGSTILFATYLGGSGSEVPAGVAVDPNKSIYVAGSTDSSNFPTTSNAFQTAATGTHGFLSRFSLNGAVYQLSYSTYLAGNGADQITGLAVQQQNAFVTGITTSTNSASGFPSTTNAYQVCPFIPGNTCSVASGPAQFFASKVNTSGTGSGSVVYSTYFGGYNPTNAQAIGGGIAVDTAGRFYFTGGTNMQGVAGSNGESPFPLLNAWQSCLNQPGITSGCVSSSALDAILVKINPGQIGSASLVYSTFLGGANNDVGHAVAVDSSPNAYVTGETDSTTDAKAWGVTSSSAPGVGTTDAFVAKVTNPTGSNTIFPLTFFNFVGGNGTDIGYSIAVDSVQAAHLTGSTTSTNLQTSLQAYGGNTDAFVSLISTTSAAGNYVTYLGDSQFDRGTSIALDSNLDSSPTFIAGETLSGNFPTVNPLQATLNGTQDAFVAQIGASSSFSLDPDSTKVNPDPASVGNQVTFTFAFVNDGPEPASNVIFSGKLPSSGFTFSSASATPGGSCPNPVGTNLTCTIGNVSKGAKATVSVVLVPTSGTTNVTVKPTLSVNSGSFTQFPDLSVSVTDFKVTADPPSATINAGESASYVLTLTPLPTYANSISVSHSTLPSNSTGTFTATSVTISGGTPATTTLSIKTTARPAQSSSLFRGGPLYAAWLPIGGLSLLGLGIGARRRRWLAGTLLGLVAGLVLLQAACGNSSSTPAPSGGTPAGTYTITLTGSSGSVTHNVPVTLIVN